MNQVAKKSDQGGEVVSVSESQAVLDMVSRAASDPTVDIDKMERLMAMRERMLDREAERAFNEALTAAQRELPAVVKDTSSDKHKYSRYETITAALRPLLDKYGFSLSFGTAESPFPQHYRVTCRVSHVGGHSRDYMADVPMDMTGPQGKPNKSATQGFGSTMSYGRRYLKALIFDVAFKDEDQDGGAPPEYISPEQKQVLVDLIKETGADTKKFCGYLRVASLDEIYTTQFARAKQALLKKKGDQQ